MIRIDLPRELITKAITQVMQSNKRYTQKIAQNPIISDVYIKENERYQNALNTMTDTK